MAHIASLVNQLVSTCLPAAVTPPASVVAEPDAAVLTQDAFAAVLNAAADDILQVTHADDSGLRDAMNLMVNASVRYLHQGWHVHDPAEAYQRLSEVAATDYDAGLDQIIDWIQERCRPGIG